MQKNCVDRLHILAQKKEKRRRFHPTVVYTCCPGILILHVKHATNSRTGHISFSFSFMLQAILNVEILLLRACMLHCVFFKYISLSQFKTL